MATEGDLDAAGKPFIDENLTCPNVPCSLLSGVNIGCENTPDKPIIGAICNLASVCL